MSKPTITPPATEADVVARDQAKVIAMITSYLADVETLDSITELGTDAVDIGGELEAINFDVDLEGEYDNFGPFWVCLAEYFTRRVALLHAAPLVVAAEREAYPMESSRNLLGHVRNTLAVLNDEVVTVGAFALDGEAGDPTYDAYMVVLNATTSEIAQYLTDAGV